ncbi:NAD(P)H-binding protein [Flavobacterium sp. '19STA2R22 D10 B1']|uniref:NAD(P)H-binding protein n=1 Tax=Flavobacterium aerium TaxID=3037261 RepID=UPI00278BF152|nr:NAD(P)H-binding protein [Flavobacterium sp. '19STA2R22 D10 B1']
MKSTAQTKEKTLVLGATGKTGRRIVMRLKELNYPVRIGSRSAEIPFDWENESTWKPALQDITTVYISFQPDLAVPGAIATIQNFTKLAVKEGVKKLILLSGRGEAEAQECERIVQEAGCNWTIIRASWFNQNFSEGNFLESIQAGFVALPVGEIGEPFIDADDIADVAVASILDDKHNGELYEVTGTHLITFSDAMKEISKATDRIIEYQQVAIHEYNAMLKEYHVPEDFIGLLTYLFTEVLDGRNAQVSNGVQRALGREPKDFQQYVREVAATGIWN